MRGLRLHCLAAAFALATLAMIAPAAGAAPGPQDIVLLEPRGDVRLTQRGVDAAARDGAVLQRPATLRTGSDGSARLRQADTSIGVGPDTQLEFPAGAGERVLQPSGNAFYDVGPRGSRRLRVETPYLVAVIKGTQFNVAVDAEASTISLFEGSLEVLAEDIGESVLLNAGEIAIRRRGEATIRVVSMTERTAATGGSDGGGDGGGSGPRATPGPVLPAAPVDGLLGGGNGSPIDPVEGKVSVDVGGTIGGLTGTQVGVGAGLGIGAEGVSLELGATAGVGGASVGAGAELDLGASGLGAGVDLGADLGGTGIEAGVDAGADVGVDPAGGVDLGIDAGIDAGLAGVDAGIDLGLDLGGGDAGLDVGVDLLGADLGLGGGDPAADPGAATGSESGGLVGGILRRTRL